MRPYIVWPWVSGLATLAVGLFVARRELSAGRGLDKLVVLGPLFVAAPLAAFGAEHLTISQFVMGAVPQWMPARLFVTYFVGVSLLAAAASLALRRYVWLSASCLALMFVLFVTTMHVPNALRGATGSAGLWRCATCRSAAARCAWPARPACSAGRMDRAGSPRWAA